MKLFQTDWLSIHSIQDQLNLWAKVPDVLLSGHHANVDKWRREQSVIRTFNKRPELLENAQLSKSEIELINKLKNNG